MGAAQLYTSGMNYSFNPKRMIFNKVTDVYLVGEEGERIEIVDDKLYRVVSGLYSAQMLSVVGDKSMNILSIVPKNEDGSPVTDFEARIIEEDGHEVKEWLALAEYIKSFPEKNSKRTVPAYYSETQDRKIVEEDKSIITRFKNPNKIALIIYALIIALIGLISSLLVFIIRRINRRRKK